MGGQMPGWLLLMAVVFTPLLHVAAFPPWNQSAAAFFFLVPQLLWLYRRPSWKSTWWVSFLVNWASWTVLLSWLRIAPQALGWHPFAAALLGWTITLALAGIVALFDTCWMAGARWFLPRYAGARLFFRVLGMLGLAGLWVLVEWLRSWIFSGFPWLPLSASQWQQPLLLQILPFTGYTGLSFLLVYFNLATAAYFHQILMRRGGRLWRRICPEFYLAVGMLFWTVSHSFTPAYFHPRLETLFTAGVVQPDIPQRQRWTREQFLETLENLARLTHFCRTMGSDLVVWPESVMPGAVLGNPDLRHWNEELSRTVGLPILMGNMAVEGDPSAEDSRWYNAVFLVDPEQGLQIEPYYRKRHLVPFGEYVPGQEWLPFMDMFVPIEGSLAAGDEPIVLPMRMGDRILTCGPLICYEDIFPSLARATVLAGADFLFVATNNAWFGEEGGAIQHAAHSVLRAVETRRPVLRSGNSGWSGLIDERGLVRDVLLDRTTGLPYFRGAQPVDVVRSLDFAGVMTPYVRYGDWFVLVCLVLTALALWRLRNERSE